MSVDMYPGVSEQCIGIWRESGHVFLDSECGLTYVDDIVKLSVGTHEPPYKWHLAKVGRPPSKGTVLTVAP